MRTPYWAGWRGRGVLTHGGRVAGTATAGIVVAIAGSVPSAWHGNCWYGSVVA